MTKAQLIERTRMFATRVFRLVDRLPRSQGSKIITIQLLKSASSVAANYRAVNRARSRADFANKLKVVLEEADESNFWLTFIHDLELIDKSDNELLHLIKESNELTAIFTSSIKTISTSGKKS